MSSPQLIIVIQEPTQIVQVNQLGLQGPPGAGPLFKHEPRVLTSLEVANNKLILNNQAEQNSLIILNVRGAPTQIRNIDYEYIPVENAISWAGLGLDSFLQFEEVVEIIYLPRN